MHIISIIPKSSFIIFRSYVLTIKNILLILLLKWRIA